MSERIRLLQLDAGGGDSGQQATSTASYAPNSTADPPQAADEDRFAFPAEAGDDDEGDRFLPPQPVRPQDGPYAPRIVQDPAPATGPHHSQRPSSASAASSSRPSLRRSSYEEIRAPSLPPMDEDDFLVQTSDPSLSTGAITAVVPPQGYQSSVRDSKSAEGPQDLAMYCAAANMQVEEAKAAQRFEDQLRPFRAPRQQLPPQLPLGSYPPQFPADTPSQISRAHEVLATLSWPQMHLGPTQDSSSYLTWELKELARNPQCHAAMLQAAAIPALGRLLSDRGLPPETHANTSATLLRLGVQNPAACAAMADTGAFSRLATMLHHEERPCREAAALALTFLGWSDAMSKAAIFEAMAGSALRRGTTSQRIVAATRLHSDALAACKRSGPQPNLQADESNVSHFSTGSAEDHFGQKAAERVATLAVLRPSPLLGLSTLLKTGEVADLKSAAMLGHMLSALLLPEQRLRLSVRGCDIVPAMTRLIGERDDAAVYAAVSLLANLAAALPSNIPEILGNLFDGLSNGTTLSRCRCAEVLWRLARSGSETTNALVISHLQTRGADLALPLTSLLENPHLELQSQGGPAGLKAVVGLLAAVTQDRTIIGSKPCVEELRLAVLTTKAALAQLAVLMRHQEEWVRTAAIACLSNLAACRASLADSKRQGAQARLKARLSNTSASAMPRAVVTMVPAVINYTANMLNSPRVEVLAAALALLNNLVADDEVRLQVYGLLSPDMGNFNALKARLLQCITMEELPDRSKRAASFVLLRLDKKPHDAAARTMLQCCAPLPPMLTPAFVDIWATAT